MGPGSHDSSMARTDLNTLILEIIPERTTEPKLGFVQGQQTGFRLRSSPDPDIDNACVWLVSQGPYQTLHYRDIRTGQRNI